MPKKENHLMDTFSREQYIIDEKGNATAVILPIES